SRRCWRRDRKARRSGQQQELHVKERIRREDHEVGRLFGFLSAGVDEGDTGGVLARSVHIDFGNLRVVTRREVRFADQDREDRRLRTGLGVIGAAEPFAKTAIRAWAETKSERIRVGARQIPRRLRKRLVTKFAGRLGKQRVAERLRLGGGRIRPRTGTLER